ncbi:coiled-coil domain-containing protein 173-like [Anguilla anguilla]|uniref:coiled-coil domain-containing protein 173-like n=1 Tax=Anguilla anguilla TaxID=7936 RepID=UPI0015ADB30F|nr:coiled-coil domain-containing protein 173-like [Anguilla anguilla]
MAVSSALVSSNGSQGKRRGLLVDNRERVLENTTRQQFYQSDRVKQFHRDLLLTETLNERKLQIERNQRMRDAANEEARKLVAELKRAEAEAMDQERQKERQREMKKKAYADDLRQQMREMEQQRTQKMLERQREMQECEQMRRQYATEQSRLRQNQRQEEMKAMNSYLEHLADKRRDRETEDKREEVAEEGRRRFVVEKDQWTQASNEDHADGFRRRMRRSEVLGAKLETQAREQARWREAANSRALAKALAQQEARFIQERNRKKQMNLDMANSIAGYREYKQKEHQLRAMEESRSSLDTLQSSKEADRAFQETQRWAAQRKREDRAVLDGMLHRQIAQKQAQEQLRKQEDEEFDLKTLELLALEDLEFQRYTKGVIDAATDADRNTLPLRKTTCKGTGVGLGPISGGIRANYLVPGANHSQIPQYYNSAARDINRLYRASEDESTERRLGFIW